MDLRRSEYRFDCYQITLRSPTQPCALSSIVHMRQVTSSKFHMKRNLPFDSTTLSFNCVGSGATTSTCRFFYSVKTLPCCVPMIDYLFHLSFWSITPTPPWAQYIVLHAEGGSTMDTDNFYCGDPRAIYRWADFHGVSFTSYQAETGQIVNSAFAAPKGHPFMRYLLHMIKKQLHITDGSFNFKSVLCDVGPRMLARAVRQYSEESGLSYPDLCAGQQPNNTASFTWSVYGSSFQFLRNNGNGLILV